MTTFTPVRLPATVRTDRISQTALKHFNSCERSAYLYMLHKGQQRTVEMVRGSALHTITERATREALEAPDGPETDLLAIVKPIVNEVLRETDVPIEEHDALREMSYRWAAHTQLPPPERIVALETLFALDVDGVQVRCRIDYAEISEDGATVRVDDYKSGRGMPSYEDVARKRPDGTYAAKNIQLVLYALVLAFGVPVREEDCPHCEGDGWLVSGYAPTACFHCGGTNPPKDQRGKPQGPYVLGTGRLETPEPFGVAARAQQFDVAFVYPAVDTRDGGLAARPCSLTRGELEEYRESLAALIARFGGNVESGEWPAKTSEFGCGICPARSQCPIPVEVRSHAGEINTDEQLAEAAERYAQDAALLTARRKEIKLAVKARGGEFRFGDGMVWAFLPLQLKRELDKDGLFEALDRGEAVERSAFERVSKNTPFECLTVEKLEAKREAREERAA